jgi:hypothetical protein
VNGGEVKHNRKQGLEVNLKNHRRVEKHATPLSPPAKKPTLLSLIAAHCALSLFYTVPLHSFELGLSFLYWKNKRAHFNLAKDLLSKFFLGTSA